MKCKKCNKEMRAWMNTYYYCESCDVLYCGYSGLQYPPECLAHAQVRMCVTWERFKKELLNAWKNMWRK